jgi:hypothetical protein
VSVTQQVNPTPPPPPEPQTAWERALRDTDEQGFYSKDAALRLFATAFGPLPGVDAQEDLTGIEDRTIAIRAIKRHLAELTGAQRKAIDAALAPSAKAVRVRIGPVKGAAAGLGVRTLGLQSAATGRSGVQLAEVSPTFREMVENQAHIWRQQISANLGHDIQGDIFIEFEPQPKSEHTLGQAWNDWPGGEAGNCQITMFPASTSASQAATFDTLAHEIFHCFQFDGYGTLAPSRPRQTG